MQMIPASSSNLSAVGYDPSDSTFVVRFRNGTTYKYLRVPQTLFDALVRAPSKGAFFNENIKERFQYLRV